MKPENITSSSNQRIQRLRALMRRSPLGGDALAVVEGPKLVREACRSGLEVKEVLVASSKLAAFREEDWSGTAGTELCGVSDRLFHSLADTVTSQGILAVVRIPAASLDSLLTGEPLLLRVEVADYEETSTPRGPLFVDVTEAAVGHNPSYRDQLLQPPDAWLNRITKASGYNKTGWQGVSVADVNGDGLDDLLLPEQGGLPNRLYVQNREGTFDDRSADAAIDYLERALAGLFVDLDNDGDPDLVLSSRPAVLVLENDGSGRFARVRHIAGDIPDSNSLSAADYDNDGDLDLYVCAYRRAYDERGVASPVPYHDANNGGRNVLLRNDGGFRFVDATAETGLDANNRRFSLAASWEDVDGDGDRDLYVANDYGRNNLYRNDGGRFVDVAGEAGVEDISSGMSVSWADYNRDGRMDVYVGNMFSAAGNRITYQRKFERDRQRAGPLAEVQRMARGNSLFAGASGGGFVDRSVDANVTMGRWSWSSVFADINNDGWEDLVVANGNLTQTLPDDL